MIKRANKGQNTGTLYFIVTVLIVFVNYTFHFMGPLMIDENQLQLENTLVRLFIFESTVDD